VSEPIAEPRCKVCYRPTEALLLGVCDSPACRAHSQARCDVPPSPAFERALERSWVEATIRELEARNLRTRREAMREVALAREERDEVRRELAKSEARCARYQARCAELGAPKEES
jgi:hypothetical protein